MASPFLEHLADDEFACWDDYITRMARDGTHGDQITLYATANLYNMDVQIVSSLGVGGSMYSVRQQVFQQLPCTLDILLRAKVNTM